MHTLTLELARAIPQPKIDGLMESDAIVNSPSTIWPSLGREYAQGMTYSVLPEVPTSCYMQVNHFLAEEAPKFDTLI